MNENCRVLMVRMSFSDDQNSLSKMYIYEKRMVVASIRIRLFTPGSLNCEPGASALHDCNIC